MGNFPGGLMNFLVLFLAFGVPALGWMFGKAKEQREAKRIKDEMRKRREEQLRTGRSDSDGQSIAAASQTQQADPKIASERQRLQDLAAKRQAQLRELRARQRSQQAEAQQDNNSQQPQQPPSTVVLRGPAPTQPAPQRSAPTPRRQPGPVAPVPTSRTQPQRRPSQTQQRPSQQQPRPQPTPVVRRVEQPQPQPRPERQRRTQQIAAPAPAPTQPKGSLGGDVRNLLGIQGTGSKKERAAKLRAAIAIREILDQPVSIRPNTD